MDEKDRAEIVDNCTNSHTLFSENVAKPADTRYVSLRHLVDGWSYSVNSDIFVMKRGGRLT